MSFKVDPAIGELPREHLEDRGGKRRYQLLATKLNTPKNSKHTMFKRPEITAHYVLVEGGGVPSIDLQQELEKVAAFGRLVPKKIAARLELFQSTATKSNSNKRDYFVFLTT